MKHIYCLVALVCIFSSVQLSAQDEGAVTKVARIGKSNGIYVSGGPSFTFGKNIGDYSKGSNFEIGYLKRLNSVISIGGFGSYSSFKYDPSNAKQAGVSYLDYGDPNDWSTTYDGDYQYNYGYALALSGGNISLASFGVTLKVNFVPVTDGTKFSIYGFAKPFVAFSNRKQVQGIGTRYTQDYYEESGELYTSDDGVYHRDSSDPDEWGPQTVDPNDGHQLYPALNSKKTTTGGISIGPGVEYFPTPAVSLFLQGAFGYTFPIDYVSTQSYLPVLASYIDPKFPMVKKGFPVLSVQFGVSFNF